jgi:hypothetical protein
MALIKCKECGKEVSSEAKKCPHCGKKLKTSSLGKGILYVFLILIGLIVLGAIISGTDKEQKIAKQKIDISAIEPIVNDFQKMGVITKLTPEYNQVFVNPQIWHRLDYQAKENFGKCLAAYCAGKKGSTTHWVEIKDAYSGKDLAKYGSFGFKVY